MPSNKTRIITVGDVHLADKNPSMRVDNYFDNSFYELGLIKQQALKEKADFVGITGDIFVQNTHTRTLTNLSLPR